MSEVKVDTISERTAAGGVTIDGVLLKDNVVNTDNIAEKTAAAGVTIDGVLVKDGVATFQTAAGSPLVFEGATADAFETTFAITDPTADRTITFPDADVTLGTSAANVPAFSVYVAAAWDLADATWTLVPIDTADINDDGASGTCFNITASGTNPRGFTVPAGEAGRYQFNYLTGNYTISNDLEVQQTVIYKGVSGGAAAAYALQNYWSFWINNGAYTLSGSTILDLAVGDHIYLYTYNACGTTDGRIAGGRERCVFSGMKLT